MKNKYNIIAWCAILWIAASSFKVGQPPKNYRYVGGSAYTVLDSTDFYLYQRYEPQEAVKGAATVMKNEYFFSRDSRSQIEPLTLSNLEKTFAPNTRFRYALEAHFCRNEDLISFDPFLKEYKIKYLYSQSLQ
jgi:hypothetical protein